MLDRVDHNELHEDVIVEAIKAHCSLLGSNELYQRQEIDYYRREPWNIVCFRDNLGRLRAYHKRGT